MKIGAISAIVAALLLGPSGAALAATVQVYPTITSSHGGTKFAVDMTSCIASECAQGVPTFTVPDGAAYAVTIQPAAGYSYTLDSNCSGVAQGDIVCHVDYQDGATIAPPVAAPAPQPAPAASGTTIVIPDTISAPATEDQALIASLQMQIIELLKQLIVLLQAKLATQV